MSDALIIQSHRGPYTVTFAEELPEWGVTVASDAVHFLVDRRVAELYATLLEGVLKARSVLVIEATESAKSLDKFPAYIEGLIERRIRRDHMLVAIGGGIIQDITCFLAACLFRGIDWDYYPTTLLAQADSCIGSKSSINVGKIKNVLGTFTPPKRIGISTPFLDTLELLDIHSGVGEMLKVHAIDGPESFDEIAADYPRLFSDRTVLLKYIRRSLEIKKRFIEEDELDRGPRNLMNYGHSFGHAIESATHYEITHGIAVTIGVDMANFVAVRYGRVPASHFQRMHPTLRENYRQILGKPIPLEAFLQAIDRDKKNSSRQLALILPNADARVEKVFISLDETFRSVCGDYFATVFRS